MDTQVLAPVQPPQREHRFSFTGTGAEYFRIWIVNLVLTILTLGIFSAWAKVRRLQYFYRNTHLADSSFDYHGSPIAILKGRIIGFVLFAAYSVAAQISPLLWLCVLLLIGGIMPYLLATSFRFRFYNSSYRGLRFGFSGSVKGAYGVFLGLPIATLFTAYLLAPFTHHRIKAYQHNNTRFGQASFGFTATEGSFYRAYIFAFLQFLGLMILLGVGAYLVSKGKIAHLHGENKILAFVLGAYALMILSMLLVLPYFISRIQNLIWNGTHIGGNRFSSTMTAKGLAWILVGNFVLTIVTLGFYKPFAAVRLARYHLQNMALLPTGDMNEFIAGEQQQAGAAGMETAAFFDIDVGF